MSHRSGRDMVDTATSSRPATGVELPGHGAIASPRSDWRSWLIPVATVLGFAIPAVSYLWMIHTDGVNVIYRGPMGRRGTDRSCVLRDPPPLDAVVTALREPHLLPQPDRPGPRLHHSLQRGDRGVPERPHVVRRHGARHLRSQTSLTREAVDLVLPGGVPAALARPGR